MSVGVVTRWQAGLWQPDANRLARRRDQVIGVTVHWTDTGPNDPVDTWRTIQENDMEGRNFDREPYGDIAYNAGFTNDGRILVGRSNEWVGAHASSDRNLANRETLGVAYVGDGEPTLQAVQALIAYLYVAVLYMKLPGPIMLRTHEDWQPFGGIGTDCPGTLTPIVHELRARYGLKA